MTSLIIIVRAFRAENASSFLYKLWISVYVCSLLYFVYSFSVFFVVVATAAVVVVGRVLLLYIDYYL